MGEWKIAQAPPGLSTCSSKQNGGKLAWEEIVNANGGRVCLFASHTCYHAEYMTNPGYWLGYQSPLTITLMRQPLDQFTSKFRYVQMCCQHRRETITSSSHSPLERRWNWCQPLCVDSADQALNSYVTKACTGKHACNEQKRYMGIAFAKLKTIIDSYDLIMISDRFDESLVVAAVLYGLPLRALPYLNRNTNKVIPQPIYTKADLSFIQSHIKYDLTLYHLAVVKLDYKIANMSPSQRMRYDQWLAMLRQANDKMAAVCMPQCAHIKEPSVEARQCWETCLDTTMAGIWVE
ncbi:hypothetical protein BASA81_003747 [Batrachochytrium salamandrivorans]|nr:hypothetical protein BASA81_003747 [Batrachochytrium salamandrivorans]